MADEKMSLPYHLNSTVQPYIRISPFLYSDLDRADDDVDRNAAALRLQKYLGQAYILTSSGRSALALVLADAGLRPEDTVTILTSTGNSYVSGCVTQTIGKTCHWSMKIEPSTRLIVVIHEWGLPYPKMDDVLKTGIPVVEDCAYAFASATNGGLVGRKGRYAIFSLPKFFPINFGGIACGVRQEDELPSEYCRVIFNSIFPELSRLASIREARTSAWQYLESAFGEIGCAPVLRYEAEETPGVFMFKPHDEVVPEEVKHAYQSHGIEASVFYPWHAIYVPCHQRLTPGAMKYMVSIYEGIWRQGRG